MATLDAVVESLGHALGDPGYRTYDEIYCRSSIQRAWQEIIKFLPKSVFEKRVVLSEVPLNGISGLRTWTVPDSYYLFHVYNLFIMREGVLVPVKERESGSISYPETSNPYFGSDEDFMYYFKTGNSIQVYYSESVLSSVYLEYFLVGESDGIFDEFVSHVIEMVVAHLRAIEGNISDSQVMFSSVINKIKTIHGVSNDEGRSDQPGSSSVST